MSTMSTMRTIWRGVMLFFGGCIVLPGLLILGTLFILVVLALVMHAGT